MDSMTQIKEQIESHTILLYMKGSPKLPNCGFSARAVQLLEACNAPFAYVDVLANPTIRADLPQYANWPTFPQLWIKGELVGGCDIMVDMYNSGDLQQLIASTTSNEQADASKSSQH